MTNPKTLDKTSQSIHLRLPPELVDRIQRLAEEEGRTWANMAKRLLELQLAGPLSARELYVRPRTK